MCITDYFLAAGIDVWTESFSSSAVHLSSLSGETKGTLRARTLQLQEQRYGTHNYETMLKWLRGTQLSDTGVNSDNEEKTKNKENQELRDEMVIEAAGALIQGKVDTDLVERIRAELDKRGASLTHLTDKSYSVIQRFSHECDKFEVFEVQDKERGSCCVCGGPAHKPHSGYCQSKSLRYIKECLSGLLGTPEIIRGTELRMGTTKPNMSAWAALVDTGCQQGEGILPLYTACAWANTGEQIMEWNAGHVCQSKEYGFLAQMKSSDL
jgi:hypothetical protein